MKATGETMSVGRTFEESLLKGIRSLEIGVYHLHMPKFDSWGREDLLDYIKIGTDDRIYAIAQLLRMGVSVEEIVEKSTIDAFFIRKLQNITAMERELSGAVMDSSVYYQAKKMGFSDRAVAQLWNVPERKVFALRQSSSIRPVYKMIDSCARRIRQLYPVFLLHLRDGKRVRRLRQEEGHRPRLRPHPYWSGRGIRLFHRPRHPDHQKRRL